MARTAFRIFLVKGSKKARFSDFPAFCPNLVKEFGSKENSEISFCFKMGISPREHSFGTAAPALILVPISSEKKVCFHRKSSKRKRSIEQFLDLLRINEREL